MFRLLFCALPVLSANAVLAQVMTSKNAQHDLTLDEVRPVLDVISRLAPLKLVSVPEFMVGSLKVCFADDPAFRPLTATLGRFQGNASWLLIAHVPLVCLAAVPEESRLRDQRNDTPPKFRQWILQDIDRLAVFLERELSLGNEPSKGIQALALPAAITGHGPGGPTYLVADPKRFLTNKFLPTSPHDRTIEYWLSDEELDQLYDVVHPSGRTETAVKELDLLKRISESTYETLIILPGEVARLKRECEEASRILSGFKDAMKRMIAICDQATSEHLGIVVIGG